MLIILFLNIDHLDFQIEHNTARPFTYGHRTVGNQTIPVASYAHQNQSLAHPYGANFRETIFLITYRPASKLELQLRYHNSFYGEEVDGAYIGRNILEDYRNRSEDFGHFTGQGSRQNINLLQVICSYRLFPNGYLDLNFTYRNQENVSMGLTSQNTYLGTSFRMNIGRQNLNF